jgi:hypothetical protein
MISICYAVTLWVTLFGQTVTLAKTPIGGYFFDMAAGRPTLYDESYCDLIIEAGREGKSLAAFAAECGVARNTLTLWAAANPEFMVALTRAKNCAAAWYEERARNLVSDGGSSAQATMIIFALKNFAGDDWRDKQEIEHSGAVEITTKEQRDAAVAAALNADG